MAGSPPSSDASGGTGDNPGAGPGREADTGPPRRVMIVGLIALIVALLFVVVLLVGGGGGHSPRRHEAPSGVTALVVQRP